MNDELKPCPFCGGEAEMLGEGVMCSNCYAEIEPNTARDIEPVAAWNTRAERTCMNVSGKQHIFRCSICGDVWAKPDVDLFAYCPSCGSKVVE